MMILRFWAADGRHVTNRIAVVNTQSRTSFICTSEISTDVTRVLQEVANEREFFAKVTLPLPVRWLDSSWDTQTELSSCAIQPIICRLRGHAGDLTAYTARRSHAPGRRI